MAIMWGPYQNKMRIGLDIAQSPGTVGQGTTSVRVTFAVWVQMDGSSSQYINDAYMQFSGDWGSGGKTFPINLGPGQSARVHVTSTTYPTKVGQATTRRYGVSVRHWFGTTGNPVRTWTVAARPAAPPAKPGQPGKPSISRQSDTKHTISWSRPGASATAVQVDRREASGSGWSAWKQVGKPSGNAASWVDTSTKANRRYEYRVRRYSAGGWSSWSAFSDSVYTTPAKPGAPSGSRVGANIRVALGGKPAYGTHYDVQDDGATVGSAVASGGFPWTHTAPNPATPHKYRVRARIASGTSNSSTLVSGWSAYSQTVQITTPPNPPSNLSPNGGVASIEALIPLVWRHNPVDSSEQTEYQLRHRMKGDPDWVEPASVVSGDEAVAVDWLDATGELEWQVRTKGAHPDWSGWSATAVVDLIDVPQVSIVAPVPVMDTPVVGVEWEFFQGQDRAQTRFEVELLDDDGVVVETRSGGTATTVTLDSRLEDRTEWTVRVRAAAGSLWSDWAEQAFEVEFIPPATPVLSGQWDETSGAMQISIGEGFRDEGPDVTNFFTNPRFRGDGTYTLLAVNEKKNPNPSLSTSGFSYPPMIQVGAAAPFGRYFETVAEAPGDMVGFESDLAGAVGEKVSSLAYVTNVSDVTISLRLRVPGSDAVGSSTTIGPGETGRVSIADAERTTAVQNTNVYLRAASTVPAGVRFVLHDGVVVTLNSPLPPFAFTGDGIMDDTVRQPEDFRTSWEGAVNDSRSRLEIENVAGVAMTRAYAAASTIDGVKGARLIGHTAGEQYALITVPTAVRPGGSTATATRVLHKKLVDSPGAILGQIQMGSTPWGAAGSGIPNVPGEYPGRVTADGASNVTSWRFHTTRRMGYDLWLKDVGVFAGDYTGPVFHGSSGVIEISDRGAKGTKWDGEKDASTSSTVTLPETVSTALYRSVDGGETWELVADGLEPSDNVTDWEALSNGYTMYRAVAYSEVGASAAVEVSMTSDSGAVWLSGGESYGLSARLPFDPEVQVDAGRNRSTHRYSGRSLPVVYAGEQTSRTVTVGGRLIVGDEECASLSLMHDIAHAEAPVSLYRDPDGNRVYGMLSEINLPREFGAVDGDVWGYNFTIEETEQ